MDLFQRFEHVRLDFDDWHIGVCSSACRYRRIVRVLGKRGECVFDGTTRTIYDGQVCWAWARLCAYRIYEQHEQLEAVSSELFARLMEEVEFRVEDEGFSLDDDDA